MGSEYARTIGWALALSCLKNQRLRLLKIRLVYFYQAQDWQPVTDAQLYRLSCFFEKLESFFLRPAFHFFGCFFSFRCSSQNSFLIDRQPTSFASPRKSFFNDRSQTRYLESSTSLSSTAAKNVRLRLCSRSFSFN